MSQRRDSGPPLKDRLYTTLYRLRYGWQFRSSVEITQHTPIWVLGKCYHGEVEDTDSAYTTVEGAPPHILAFMEHYHSIPWMTYRANFSQIRGTTLSTDCGWGCMVRSGQMILATALHRHLLNQEWRFTTSNVKDLAMHKQILSWFADLESEHCPFSLHCLMRIAKKHGYRPGDWFGPSQVAVLIRDCVRRARKHQPMLANLEAYVAYDCTVYVNDVLDLFGDSESQGLLLLVPVRLGSEALNPIYIPCVKSLLALDHSVGIIGGKPKHSVYFVGFQDDKLLHLDPHYCQMASEASKSQQLDDSLVRTYHCTAPRKLTASKMDPSCTIGFYCRNRSEFIELREKAEKVLAPPLQKGVYPFFTFIDQRADDAFTDSFEQHLNSLSGHGATMSMSDPNSSLKKRSRRGNSCGKEMDDFIIEDNDDFVIVNRRPSASLSKNLLSSLNSAEDDFIMGDEEILAGGGDFGFVGDRVMGMGEGEELQGRGEESELPQDGGEESCLLQNGVEPHLVMQLNGEESEVPQTQEDKLCLLPQQGVEPILQPEERVELQLSQERGVESQLEWVEPQSLQQKGVEPILLPEEMVKLQLSRERGVESHSQQQEGVEQILLPEEEVELHLSQERGVESHLLQEPITLPEEGVEPYLLHQEGEESQLLPAAKDSSAAERGGVIPQELADTFT